MQCRQLDLKGSREAERRSCESENDFILQRGRGKAGGRSSLLCHSQHTPDTVFRGTRVRRRRRQRRTGRPAAGAPRQPRPRAGRRRRRRRGAAGAAAARSRRLSGSPGAGSCRRWASARAPSTMRTERQGEGTGAALAGPGLPLELEVEKLHAGLGHQTAECLDRDLRAQYALRRRVCRGSAAVDGAILLVQYSESPSTLRSCRMSADVACRAAGDALAGRRSCVQGPSPLSWPSWLASRSPWQ